MKNKLLVSLFVVVAASLAFTSCKPKSDAKDVCDDLLKTSIHKSPRSLLILNGETLTIKEYEFASANVGDNRVTYREMSFGNGAAQTKKVENLTFQYGAWDDHYTAYSLSFSPATPYASVWYRGNSFIAPDGLVFGGEASDNTARVVKWDKTLGTFLNTKWEGVFADKFVLDSVMRDSVRYIPFPKPGHYDTIKIWTGKMDTLNADTTCTYHYEFMRDSSNNKNSGHFFQRSIRSEYDRATKTKTIISDKVLSEYDYEWYFSEVSSDAKFKIVLKDPTTGDKKDMLDISKYKYDMKVDTIITYDTIITPVDTTIIPSDTIITPIITHEFLRGGLMHKRIP